MLIWSLQWIILKILWKLFPVENRSCQTKLSVNYHVQRKSGVLEPTVILGNMSFDSVNLQTALERSSWKRELPYDGILHVNAETLENVRSVVHMCTDIKYKTIYNCLCMTSSIIVFWVPSAFPFFYMLCSWCIEGMVYRSYGLKIRKEVIIFLGKVLNKILVFSVFSVYINDLQ